MTVGGSPIEAQFVKRHVEPVTVSNWISGTAANRDVETVQTVKANANTDVFAWMPRIMNSFVFGGCLATSVTSQEKQIWPRHEPWFGNRLL